MGDTSDLKIVLSYRRDDSADVSGRIFDRLVKHFGDDRMFIDIDNIPLGTDFHDHLGHTLENCGALLAVIGKAWSGPRRGRSARIMDEDDWVRLEVEAALARQVPVIPILVGNAELPAREQLPASLIPLRRRQSLSVDSGVDFHQHMNRLIAALERLLDQQRQARAPEPVRSAPSEPVSAPRDSAPLTTAAVVNRPEPVKRDLQGRLTEPNAGEAGRSAFVRNARLAMIVLGIVMAVVLIASWMDQPVEYTAAEETAAYDPAYDGTADAADAAADAAMADASAAPEAAVDAPATDAATTDYYASDAPAE